MILMKVARASAISAQLIELSKTLPDLWRCDMNDVVAIHLSLTTSCLFSIYLAKI